VLGQWGFLTFRELKMTSSYKGLFVIYTNEKATDVQVEDVGGNSLPLPLDDYLHRDVKPNWRTLPSQDEYQQLQRGR